MIVELVVVWIVVAGIWYCCRAVARSVATGAAESDDLHGRRVRRAGAVAMPHVAGLVIDESEMVWAGLDDRRVERLLRDSAS